MLLWVQPSEQKPSETLFQGTLIAYDCVIYNTSPGVCVDLARKKIVIVLHGFPCSFLYSLFYIFFCGYLDGSVVGRRHETAGY